MGDRAIGGVLLLYCVGLVYEALHLGLTIDEPSHFTAGQMYWLGSDVVTPSDAPPLTRLVSGWVPRLMRAPDPRTTKWWSTLDGYLIGGELLGPDNPRARRLLRFTRLPFLVFPIVMVYVIWRWARQMFREGTALCVALSAALEPTIFGSAPLIKSDVPAACSAVVFAYAAWRYWRQPNVRQLAVMTLTLVIAVLTKYTLLPLIVLGYCLALWKGPHRLAVAVAIPLALYAGIIAGSGFEAQPVPEADVGRFPAAGVPEWAMPVARLAARLPWPPQFVQGLIHIGSCYRAPCFPGYMMGHRIDGWVPTYFPLAWLLKYPIPLQALAIAGLAAVVVRARRRQCRIEDLLVWGLAAFFFGSAVLSNFHIGFRHVIPALPFLILGGGFAIERWATRRTGRTAVALGLAYLAVCSLHVFPNGLSYFNEWIGGPSNGWRYLADSNVDWGQNLPDLGEYVRRNRITELKAFLWTSDNRSRYFPPDVLVSQPIPAEDWPPGIRFDPKPGLYAVSANYLAGFLLPRGYENYLQYFRCPHPVGRAGYSIFIYEVR